MSEWWTYRLSDLILFSAHAYYRLIELYNAAIWPAQLLGLGLGITAFVLARKQTPRQGGARRPPGPPARWIAIILALCWLWIAIGFHAARYATLNTAAPYFGWIFGIEAVLLLVFAFGLASAQGISFDRDSRAGYSILLFALLIMPFAATVLGRGWRASE